MLLNIDKPLKRATLHNEFCSFVPKPHGTKLKPLGRLGQDGGWFHVASEPEGVIAARREFPQASSGAAHAARQESSAGVPCDTIAGHESRTA